jgi:hypothetical protein
MVRGGIKARRACIRRHGVRRGGIAFYHNIEKRRVLMPHPAATFTCRSGVHFINKMININLNRQGQPSLAAKSARHARFHLFFPAHRARPARLRRRAVSRQTPYLCLVFCVASSFYHDLQHNCRPHLDFANGDLRLTSFFTWLFADFHQRNETKEKRGTALARHGMQADIERAETKHQGETSASKYQRRQAREESSGATEIWPYAQMAAYLLMAALKIAGSENIEQEWRSCSVMLW